MSEAADVMPEQKDIWDKLDVLAKLSIPVIVVGLTVFANHLINKSRAQATASSLFSELSIKREELESDIRRDMFKEIIANVVGKADNDDDVERDVINLEILAYNFHESIDTKPLFDFVLSEIADHPALKQRVLNLAKSIRKMESSALKQDNPPNYAGNIRFYSKIGLSQQPTIIKDKAVKVGFYDYDKTKDRFEFWVELSDAKTGDFISTLTGSVDPFSFPMVHNFKIGDGQRFALVMDNRKEASGDGDYYDFDAIIFPETHSSLKNRPYYEDLLLRLRELNSVP